MSTVDTGEAIFTGEATGEQGLPGFLHDLAVTSESNHGFADIKRRFRLGKILVVLDGITPGGFGDPEMIQHLLRAQEAWGEGDNGNFMGSQLARQ